jgi:hypothetical protein
MTVVGVMEKSSHVSSLFRVLSDISKLKAGPYGLRLPSDAIQIYLIRIYFKRRKFIFRRRDRSQARLCPQAQVF